MIAILGLLTIAGFVVSLLTLVILAIRKKRKNIALIFLATFFVLFVVCVSLPTSDGSEASNANSVSSTATNSLSEETQDLKDETDAIAFSGENYTAEYLKCWEASGLTGCFYIDVKINNIGDKECIYLLDDVYADDTHCQSGSGLPITALPSKNVRASFVVFCETPLSEISNVEFKLNVLDSENYNTLETSNAVSVMPNA